MTFKVAVRILPFFVGLFIVSFMLFFIAPKVEAITLNPDPGSSMPSNLRDYLIDCDSYGQSPAFVQWVSNGDDPSIIRPVAYGEQVIPLDWNVAGAVCRPNSAVYETRFQAISAVAYDETGPAPVGVGSVNNLVGDIGGLNFLPNHQSVGRYDDDREGFSFDYGSPLTSSKVIRIEVYFKVINRFSNGNYLCVPSPGGDRGGFNYANCNTTKIDYWLELRVGPPPNILPSGTIRAECSGSVLTVEVTGSDPDGGTVGVRVDVEPSLGSITELGTRTYNNRPRDGVSHNVSGYITDAQTGSRVNLADVSYNCPLPPPDVSCGGASPSAVDANVPFDLVLGVSNNSPSRDVSYVLRTSAINGQVYSQNVATPVGTSRTATFNIAGGLPVGIYNFTWTYTDGTYGPGGDKPACTGSITVSAKLLTTVFGGDVQAGAGISYGSGCSTVNRNVSGFLSGVGNNLRGSSVQLGIFAMRHIDGVRSAGQIVPSAPANQLAFANSGLPASNTSIGGSFGVASPCVNDYYGLSGGSTALPSVDLSTLADGRYIVGNGGSTTSLTTGAGIANARQIVVFVDGDVIINGSTFGYANTSWSNTSDLPSLYIIARGSIYVDSAVQRMDGVYIAQQKLNSGNPVDGTGEIFSCSVAGDRDLVRPSVSYDIVTSCGQQLVVNGAFIGRRVHLIRSYGSLSNITPITNTIVATNSATWGSSAEVFRYTSELFMRRNDFLAPNSGGLRYDAITSLAPAL